ncbi:MAG: hypothetical protein M5U26_01805 [Planctomycetota bacterium]|nr:hypothetical protein [Planctomycetota bacterium]
MLKIISSILMPALFVLFPCYSEEKPQAGQSDFDPKKHEWARFPVGAWVTLKATTTQKDRADLEEIRTMKLDEKTNAYCKIDVYEGEIESVKKVESYYLVLKAPECARFGSPSKPKDGENDQPLRLIGEKSILAIDKEVDCKVYEVGLSKPYVMRLHVSKNDGTLVLKQIGEFDREAEQFTEIEQEHLKNRDSQQEIAGRKISCLHYQGTSIEGPRVELYRSQEVPGGIVLREATMMQDGVQIHRIRQEVMAWGLPKEK